MAFELKKLWLWAFPGQAQQVEEAGDGAIEEVEQVVESLSAELGPQSARCKRRGHPIFIGQKQADCFDCYRLDIREREWSQARHVADDRELVGVLLCLKGNHRGQAFPLLLSPDQPVTVGANPDCDIVLSDSSVSRRHVAAIRRQARTVLRDLGSSQHTALRAEGDVQWQVMDPEREYWFRDGSHLLVGEVELLFRCNDDQGLRVWASGARDQKRRLPQGEGA